MFQRFYLSALDAVRFYLLRQRGRSNEDIASYLLGSDYADMR